MFTQRACAKLFIDLFRIAKHWKNYRHSLMGSTHGLQPWECQGRTVGAHGNVDAFPCRHSEWMPIPKGHLPYDSRLGDSWNDKRVGMENRSAVAHLLLLAIRLRLKHGLVLRLDLSLQTGTVLSALLGLQLADPPCRSGDLSAFMILSQILVRNLYTHIHTCSCSTGSVCLRDSD